MKRRSIIGLCLFGGCILGGIVIGTVFRVEQNQQSGDYSARRLTDEEREQIIEIALNDTRVKEMLKGKEYKISGVHSEWGKEVSCAYPTVTIYVGEDNWTEIKAIYPLVDLDKKKVTRIREYRWVKSIIPEGATGKEREEAIDIALNNESVKEKLEEFRYRVVGVYAFKKWITGEKLDTDAVYIHVNGTTVCYDVKVNLTEKRVTDISIVLACGRDEVGEKKTEEAVKIALNDSRVKNKIKGRVYEITTKGELIENRFVVDVKIDIKEPPERYVATVDTEVWKVRVWKIAHGTFFEKEEEIK